MIEDVSILITEDNGQQNVVFKHLALFNKCDFAIFKACSAHF